MADNPFSEWMTPSPDPFREQLDEADSAAYYSFANDWATPNQQMYFQNQFQNVYNQYLGALGASLRQGSSGAEGGPASVTEALSPTFMDYLENYDWTDRYTSLPPAMRGDFTSQFNPRTRQIYF